MGGLEAVLTGLKDEMAGYLNRFRFGREVFTLVICFSACLFAIPNVTQVGRLLMPGLANQSH